MLWLGKWKSAKGALAARRTGLKWQPALQHACTLAWQSNSRMAPDGKDDGSSGFSDHCRDGMLLMQSAPGCLRSRVRQACHTHSVFGANPNAPLQAVAVGVVAAAIGIGTVVGKGTAVGIGAIACPAAVSRPAMAVARASGVAVARRPAGAGGSGAALKAMHVTLKTATSTNTETSRTTGSRMTSRTTEARARGKTTEAKARRRTTYANAGRRTA